MTHPVGSSLSSPPSSLGEAPASTHTSQQSPQQSPPHAPVKPYGQTLPASPGDSHSLAVHLEPVLRQACDGKLGPVEWFNAAWQHGGAATGFAAWNDPDGPSSVLVKLPVGPNELRWSCDLSDAHDRSQKKSPLGPVVPRVLASGVSLGGLDLGWIVCERLEGAPLAKAFDQRAIHELLHTAVEFQQAAASIRPPHAAESKALNWHENIARAKEAVRQSHMADHLRWLDAIKHIQKALPLILARWNTRPLNAWCHGDLHPGNALRRLRHGGRSRCVLIDLALVHAGHWAEDAVYLERQYWGHAELLHGIKPLAEFSRLRREAGLPVDTHATDVAIARRLLMASVVPLFLGREHNAKYVRGALEVIEKYLPQLH